MLLIQLHYLKDYSRFLSAKNTPLTPSDFATINVNKYEIFTVSPTDVQHLNCGINSIVRLKNDTRDYYCSNAEHDIVSQVNSPEL